MYLGIIRLSEMLGQCRTAWLVTGKIHKYDILTQIDADREEM